MRHAPVTDDLNPAYLANVIQVRSEPFYLDALRLAENSSELREVLGHPLEASLPSGGIHSLTEESAVKRDVARMLLSMTLQAMRAEDTNPDIHRFAHVSVVLTGTKGSGKLIILAFDDGNGWEFRSLDVDIDGLEDRVRLMPPTG